MTKQTLITALLAAGVVTAAPSRPRAADGCGISHHEGYNDGTDSHSIQSGEKTRTYAVNVPNGYNDDTSKRRALIIDYHGSGGTSYQQYDNSQYYKYPKGEEYLVVYPQAYGSNKSWEGPTYAYPGIDDIGFTNDLLTHMEQEYCVDSSRVYASGKSNGGGFVDTLACSDVGDRFAAFAMASAALYTDTSKDSCTKKRAILESHGDKDTTIPYHPTEPGRGGPLPDISKWITWWGHRTCGSNAQSNRSGDLGGYNTTSYSCNGWNKVVDHYQVFDLGHCWPSSSGDNYDASKTNCDDKVLDYTPVVLDFFEQWTVESAPQN